MLDSVSPYGSDSSSQGQDRNEWKLWLFTMKGTERPYRERVGMGSWMGFRHAQGAFLAVTFRGEEASGEWACVGNQAQGWEDRTCDWGRRDGDGSSWRCEQDLGRCEAGRTSVPPLLPWSQPGWRCLIRQVCCMPYIRSWQIFSIKRQLVNNVRPLFTVCLEQTAFYTVSCEIHRFWVEGRPLWISWSLP